MASLAHWFCSPAQNGGYDFLLTSLGCSIAVAGSILGLKTAMATGDRPIGQ